MMVEILAPKIVLDLVDRYIPIYFHFTLASTLDFAPWAD